MKKHKFLFLFLMQFVAAQGEDRAFRQDVYIWQRAWNAAVTTAVKERGPKFSELVSLKAEVSLRKGEVQFIEVPVDFAALRASGARIGLALRIGSFSGPFRSEGKPINTISNLVASMLREAKTNGVFVHELHIDFDCAESHLAGYRIWTETLRRQIAPVPLVVTALPTWLHHPDFKALVEAVDGYVLQVHSFERPRNIREPFTLCDPQKAWRAVEKANQFGVPFRVALPTYGYTVAFDSRGEFVGLSAEGPLPKWKDAQLREIRSNPSEMAALVREWRANQPKMMQGIIWYRLPVSADVLNWSWPALSAVMEGRVPVGKLQAVAHSREPGLVDLVVINSGDNDVQLTNHIDVLWKQARVISSDALHGFDLIDNSHEKLQFRPRQFPPLILKPGERRAFGWIRFSRETEVQIETSSQ